MPLIAPSPRFPAIHPFAIRVVDPLAPLRLGGLQHPLLGGEKVIGREQGYGTEALIGDVGVVLQRVVIDGVGHGISRYSDSGRGGPQSSVGRSRPGGRSIPASVAARNRG